ncbi:MAG: hemolysin III family protein [Mariniblastus sp.]|nr:hemolysin III family protein [Mariniblastus sp.]
MLLLIWLIAVIGIYLRLVYFESISYVVGTSIFIAMGWVGGFSGLLIRFQYGAGHIGPLLVGGVCYTLGAILDSANWPFVIPAVTGPHEILHLLVLADLGCHWSFISRIASEKTSSAVAKVVHKNGYSEGSPRSINLTPNARRLSHKCNRNLCGDTARRNATASHDRKMG